jgi:hypothetical protein
MVMTLQRRGGYKVIVVVGGAKLRGFSQSEEDSELLYEKCSKE